MNETQVDAIIQDCVSKVRLLHFIRREINNMLVEAIFFKTPRRTYPGCQRLFMRGFRLQLMFSRDLSYLHVPFHVITARDIRCDCFERNRIKKDQSSTRTVNQSALAQRFFLAARRSLRRPRLCLRPISPDVSEEKTSGTQGTSDQALDVN